MKVYISVLFVMFILSIHAATATWTGISKLMPETGGTVGYQDTTIYGAVHTDDSGQSSIQGLFYTHSDLGQWYIKAFDYSTAPVPVNTLWYMAMEGDVFGAESLSQATQVAVSVLDEEAEGGSLINNPGSFYLTFVTEEWGDYCAELEDGRFWYGWVNVAINSNGYLDVLGSGINLDGGPVIVGGVGPTPEPASGVLVLLGLAALGLRRRRGWQVARGVRGVINGRIVI